METRGTKRKRFMEMKKELSVELQKLTNASGDFNNDLHSTNKEFEGMFKTIADKQTDFLSRSVVVEEQYRETIAVLKGVKQGSTSENRGQNIDLPITYSEDIRKFAADVKTSLIGHGEFFTEENEDMEKLLKKYNLICSENMKGLRARADVISAQRNELCTKLSQFITMADETEEGSESSEEEDDGEESGDEA